MILNLIFLKYATAVDMDKLLAPFYGEGASHSTYDPANLLILEDNSRNMKRTMELIGLFDSDTFAGQRVRLFDVENSRPPTWPRNWKPSSRLIRSPRRPLPCGSSQWTASTR